MSLSFTRTWIRKMIRVQAAIDAALQLIDKASDQRLDGTLIVGPQLTVNGKCYLVRWDGRELVVLELTPSQQDDWHVNPTGLVQAIQPTELLMDDSATEPMVALDGIQIDDSPYDGWTPLCGRCRFEIDGSPPLPIGNVALRIKYFHPNLPYCVTAMWYAAGAVLPPGGELRFQFPPLFSDDIPCDLHGPLAVFVQMFAAEDWATRSGCRKVSNVTATMLRLR